MKMMATEPKIVSAVTPVGTFWMVLEGEILVRSGFGDVPADLVGFTVDNHPYLDAVNRYFTGDMAALGIIKYMQKGSPFHEAVWRAMSTIEPGRPVSYKELAAMAGYPLAVRAVGTACGANNLPLVVPCHRVVKADGAVGNYAYGTDIKAWLLDHENRSQKL